MEESCPKTLIIEMEVPDEADDQAITTESIQRMQRTINSEGAGFATHEA
jgi:hypothetical protein